MYVAGVVLGNARLPHRQAMLGFADGLAWLAQIGLFVLLGLLASPARLVAAVLPALVVGLVAGAAGPAAVGAGRARRRSGVGLREQAFLSWAGLRGAVPIVLATIPLSPACPGAERCSTSSSCWWWCSRGAGAARSPPVARRLGVTAPGEATELQVETAPLERMRADLLQLEIPEGRGWPACTSTSCGCRSGASVTLVLRDGVGFVPGAGHPAAGRRQPADRGDRAGAGRGRAPAAGGEPARAAGPVVRRERRATDAID